MIDFPEPLFETHLLASKVCLVCGQRKATTVLRTTNDEIVPLCGECSADWNVYGYQILRRIHPGRLIRRLVMFKLGHPFQPPSMRSLWHDIAGLKNWAGKMKKWIR